jgi:transcriptional regulator with XRE-family HTH domain
MFGTQKARDTEEAMTELRELLEDVPESPIRDLRARAGLKQAELAQKAKFAQQYVSDYELGKRPIPPDAAKSLGKALGVPASTLMAAQRLASLKEAVEVGQEPDPEELLRLLLFLDQTLPEGEFLQELRATVVGAIEAAVQGYKSQKIGVATKTRDTRDGFGRRKGDPLGLGLKANDPEAPKLGRNGRIIRDAHGRVRHKPNTPRR